jgi:hypothetical protein
MEPAWKTSAHCADPGVPVILMPPLRAVVVSEFPEPEKWIARPSPLAPPVPVMWMAESLFSAAEVRMALFRIQGYLNELISINEEKFMN